MEQQVLAEIGTALLSVEQPAALIGGFAVGLGAMLTLAPSTRWGWRVAFVGGVAGLAPWSILNEFILPYFTAVRLPVSHIWQFTGMAALGAAVAGAYLRYIVPAVDRMAEAMTKDTSLARNAKTDVRDIHKMLPPEPEKFDPREFFDLKRGIFVGLDERNNPVYELLSFWRESHWLLTGRTRSGKGVGAQILLPQAVLLGDFVVVLDPKLDAWLPSVLQACCATASKKYVFADLRRPAPAQFNLISNCDEETIYVMLVGGCGLSEKGEAADFYRLADRNAARAAARWLASHPGTTIAECLAAIGASWAEEAPAFHAYMQELADLPAINGKGGFDIASGERNGGVLYVVGDMIDPAVIRVQRMILLRLLYLAKNRDQTADNRTITVFADEFKVHISRPFLSALGMAAGWGLHCVLAFQSLQDLADAPNDMDKEAIKGAVMENCHAQLSYAVKDPETARWLAETTGKIQVDDEIRRVERNAALAETVSNERTIRQAERNLIDTNMLLMLPKGCGVFTVAGKLARFIFTSPTPIQRDPAAVTSKPAPSGMAFKPADLISIPSKQPKEKI